VGDTGLTINGCKCGYCGKVMTTPACSKEPVIPGELSLCWFCVARALIKMTVILHTTGSPNNQIYGSENRIASHATRVRKEEAAA
jgi:hypothetical protein